MRILVGVDRERLDRAGLTLLSRLQFFEPDVTLLHVDETSRFPVALPNTPTFGGTTAAVRLDRAGEATLADALGDAQSQNLNASAVYEAGDPASEILLQARQLPADLVVLGAREHGPFGLRVLGSVGNKLTNESAESILIARGEVAPAGRLRCLFATDFSEVSRRSLDRFLSWRPAGISEVTVFNAIARDDQGRSCVEAEKAAARSCAEVASRLDWYGIPARMRLTVGNPAHEIDAAMKELKADMLVIGARGHGFLERWRLGSIASSVVAHASYPVLVVRPI